MSNDASSPAPLAHAVRERRRRTCAPVAPSYRLGRAFLRCADTTAIRRLVVCRDGTPAGETIVPWATRWSVATGVPLVLVRVVYPLVDAAARIPPTEEQLDDLGYVRRLALRFEQAGHRVVDVTVQHASASDALVDLAEDIPGALLAVSTAAADPLEGSTAAQLVRSSSVPVLVASRA